MLHTPLHEDIHRKRSLALHQFFRVIWTTLVAVFVPAMLYSEFWVSLAWIFLFSAISALTIVIANTYFSRSFTAKRWSKPALIVGILFLFVYLLLLWVAKHHEWLIYIVPVLAWLHSSIYRAWIHYSMILISQENESHTWRDMAYLETAKLVWVALAPLVWWLVADRIWIDALMYVWWVCTLASIVPLLSDHHPHVDTSRKVPSWNKFTQSTFRVWSAYLWIWVLSILWTVFWSLYIFIAVGSFTTLWRISAISSVIVIIAVWLIWSLADSHPEKTYKIHRWIVRSHTTTRILVASAIVLSFFSTLFFTIADFIQKLMMKLWSMISDKSTYTQSIHCDFDEQISILRARQTSIEVARVLLCWWVALIAMVTTNPIIIFSIPCLVAALSAPSQLVLSESAKSVSSPL